ncbi:MAG: hypothetical protein IPM25_08675 [Chloracidobacterium sp.]|nr:hypothetical protein [Chloracidobacterium sp.]
MDLGLTATAVDKLPEVARHEVGVPRIALVHTWVNTQNEGWYRVELERLGIPYDYISDQDVGRMADLREKYDAIIWGPVGGNAQSIVRGIAKFSDSEAPIPWKASVLTPNIGLTPDQTDDIRGGMGVQGVANLQKFIESGGLFITIGNNASIPIDFGMVSGVTIQDARNLQCAGPCSMQTLPTAAARSHTVTMRSSRCISTSHRFFKCPRPVEEALAAGEGAAARGKQADRPAEDRNPIRT